MRSATAALLAGMTIAACAPQAAPPPPAADPAAVKAAIEAANAKLIAAAEKGDAAAAAASYDADAQVMGPGGPAWKGGAEITKGFTDMLGAVTIKGMGLEVESVVVGGDYATETGKYKWTMTPKKGAAMEDHGKYIVVWKKQADGSWKLFRDIWSTDIAPKS